MDMTPFWSYRWRAALTHLSVSVLIALISLALVFKVWYPSPLDQALDVRHIYFLVLAVDVTLGPVITFIIFNVRKPRKELVRDLAVIVAVQLAALVYGQWTIAQGRPAWLVFNADRFDLTQASDIDTRHQAQAVPAYRHAPWTGPRWVASVNPSDPAKRNQLILESAGGGPDLPQRIDLFVPLASQKAAMLAKALPLAKLDQFNSPERIKQVLAQWPQADAWLPLMARVHPMTVLIQRSTGQPLAVVDLRPWA
jgi:hypothetical protein